MSRTIPKIVNFLPEMGVRPYWADRLDSLAERVREQCEEPDWSWTEGGCFAFAEALATAHKGELWGFCAYDTHGDDYPVHHAVVKVSDRFYDCTGMIDPAACAAEISAKVGEVVELRCRDDEQVYWFTDDFLTPAESKELSAALRKA